MSEPVEPDNPTEGQQAQAQNPTDDAKKVAREDAVWREENPDQPRTRDAAEGVGGESFAYLNVVSGG